MKNSKFNSSGKLFGIGKKSWTLLEIIETFFENSKEIRISENKEGKLIIEVIIDDKIKRVFEERRYSHNIFFYEQ